MAEMSALPEATRPRDGITRVVCPYLLSADGGWRASSPSRAHRCTAVVPAAILAPDKQRRLCLTSEHAACATYVAAMEAVAETGRGTASRPVPSRTSARPIVRTTPVVLDHGLVRMSMPILRRDSRLAQVSVIGLMVLAFAAILLARTPVANGPGGVPAGQSGATATPRGDGVAATTNAPATPPPEASATPTRTLVPTEDQPSAATPPTAAPAEAGTYKVKRGDTLSGIATSHGTTWQVLAELNKIKDPARLRVGQVLQLP